MPEPVTRSVLPPILALATAVPESIATWVVLFHPLAAWVGKVGATAIAVAFVIAASASVWFVADRKMKTEETKAPTGTTNSKAAAIHEGDSFVRFGNKGFESRGVDGLYLNENTFINTPVLDEGGKNHRRRKNKFRDQPP